MSLNENTSTWKLYTNKTFQIPYKLLEDYPQGSFEEEKGEITEKYLIKAEDLTVFVQECFSDYWLWPGGSWEYTPARSYPGDWSDMYYSSHESGTWTPDDKKKSPLVVQKIDFKPYPPSKPGWVFPNVEMGKPESFFDDRTTDRIVPGPEGNTYLINELSGTYSRFLEVTITYAPGKSKQTYSDVLEIKSNPTGEFLVYSPKGNSKWRASDDAPTVTTVFKDFNLSCTKVQPGIEWSVKYKRVPFNVMFADENDFGVLRAMQSILGKVNETPVPILGGTEYDDGSSDTETLLFVGFSYEMVYSWRDKYPYVELELKLVEKRIMETGTDPVTGNPKRVIKDHNHFLNPTTHKWERLLDSSNYSVYELADIQGILFNKDG